MIRIAARLKPFSHKIGSFCMIPGTSIQLQAFPTLLRFADLATEKKWEEKLPWKGPVVGFTLEMDLEKSAVSVFGHTAEGFRRHVIVGKRPENSERLSLGKHTKLDWELVLRRMSVEEIVPVLFLLGQQTLPVHATSPSLKLLQFSDKRDIAPQLKNFFRVGFQGILVPRLADEEFQGIVEEGETQGSPLALLTYGYQAIRALFFQEEASSFSLLPNLPPDFHAGRLTDLLSSQGDSISLEWSKKLLKRVIIKPAASRRVFISLQKSLHSYRINRKMRQAVDLPLELEAGKTLFLDRFEK